MRRLIAGIAPLVVALMFTFGGTLGVQAGGTDHITAAERDNGFITLASHEVGNEMSIVAYCMAMKWIDFLMEQAIIPANSDRYREIMVEEENIPCVDHRFWNEPPLFMLMEEYQKTITTNAGLVLEVWKVVDTSGIVAYTWVIHKGQDT